MDKRIERILKEQEDYNRRNFSAIVPRETGTLLHTLIRMKDPKSVLEIGTSIGYSAIWIASALRKGARLTCIDHSSDRSAIAKAFFARAKLPIRHMEGDALKIIPKLKGSFDVIFIDATKSEYLRYIKAAKPKRGTLIIADNVISHAGKMQDFLGYIQKKGGIILPIGSGVALLQL